MSDQSVESMLSGFHLPSPLGFGVTLAPLMYRAEYFDGEWHPGQLVPYAPLQIDPAATVLHYAQQVFEGLKAYRVLQDVPTLFRPEMNYFRLLGSSDRMCVPSLPPELFAESIASLTAAFADFIPGGSGQSLYLRPFVMGTGPCLAVKSSDAFTYLLIASPSDAYFAKPIRVRIERTHCRAAVGGTGADKTGGNYAASLKATLDCIENGYDQPLWLDPAHRRHVEELSGMNVMAVIDGQLHTPRLGGSILPGITRDSLLQLARLKGFTVVERDLPIDELLEIIDSKRCSELFACGTAAIVCPIKEVADTDGTSHALGGTNEVANDLRQAIIDLQEGRSEDTLGWTVDATDREALRARLDGKGGLSS